ncbi:putative glycosyltransferase At5g03795 [Curcuma longa]|uniref:putative glycosyltransferase At5g03795 n=1 Tax=Curcuma longa TaxID=136217 RepID=UPI003D9EE9E1
MAVDTVLEKSVSRLASGGGWRAVLVFVALAASAAVLLASFSTSASVPTWFSIYSSSSSSSISSASARPPVATPAAVEASGGEKVAPLGAYGPASADFSSVSIVDKPPTTNIPYSRSCSSISLERDLQLLDAKEEIARAPPLLNDSDLHAPLFLNVSAFKRSYELMEKILKVYVYKEGEKPLCHTPELEGIYASEGWFMKLMEENKHFVVHDPDKAHLFYLPYSSRQLRMHLYVPDSHSMQPLSIFLRDYVNLISAKYPFWNRTKGSDHFLVACHDWATYTTKLHEELRRNAIKVVCNADVSEGIFLRGKDVSLPETYVKMPKDLHGFVGGKPASQRPIFAFFAGQMHGRVRPVLVEHWKGKDSDMQIYEVLPAAVARRMSYIEHMKSSRFCICPMGYEVNSPRIVEAIHYECVPVIIADNFVLPFEELLDWTAFSVVVPEKEIPNLKKILKGISERQYTRMQTNVKKLQRHFLWNSEPVKYDLFHMILHSVWFSRLNQMNTNA